LGHPRLAATVFHEWHIGKAVQLGEPAIDIRHHRLKQDAASPQIYLNALVDNAVFP
jgi:hypothetical protein